MFRVDQDGYLVEINPVQTLAFVMGNPPDNPTVGDVYVDNDNTPYVYTGETWTELFYGDTAKDTPARHNCINCGAPLFGHRCIYCDTFNE